MKFLIIFVPNLISNIGQIDSIRFETIVKLFQFSLFIRHLNEGGSEPYRSPCQAISNCCMTRIPNEIYQLEMNRTTGADQSTWAGGGFYTSLFYLVTFDHSPIFHKSLYFFLTGRHAGVHDYDVHGFLAVRPVRSLHPDLLSLPYLRHRADV